jgi:hypothetical protein
MRWNSNLTKKAQLTRSQHNHFNTLIEGLRVSDSVEAGIRNRDTSQTCMSGFIASGRRPKHISGVWLLDWLFCVLLKVIGGARVHWKEPADIRMRFDPHVVFPDGSSRKRAPGPTKSFGPFDRH